MPQKKVSDNRRKDMIWTRIRKKQNTTDMCNMGNCFQI